MTTETPQTVKRLRREAPRAAGLVVLRRGQVLSYAGGMLPGMTATPRHTALLDATPPYRLAASLRALSGFAPCAGDQCVVGTGVRKAFLIPGAGSAAVVQVGPRPDQDPGVALQVYADRPLSADEATGLEQAVTRWLGLPDDLRPFLAIARDDPPMAPLLAAADGLHQVRFASLAEGACYFLLTHRTSQVRERYGPTSAGGRTSPGPRWPGPACRPRTAPPAAASREPDPVRGNLRASGAGCGLPSRWRTSPAPRPAPPPRMWRTCPRAPSGPAGRRRTRGGTSPP